MYTARKLSISSIALISSHHGLKCRYVIVSFDEQMVDDFSDLKMIYQVD